MPQPGRLDFSSQGRRRPKPMSTPWIDADDDALSFDKRSVRVSWSDIKNLRMWSEPATE